MVETADAPSYVYAYLPQIDAVSHHHGTESEQFQETLSGVWNQLDAFLQGLDPEIAEETLLLVTADHGHVDTTDNVDLSTNKTVMGNLQRHADGTPVTMAGSPRNTHLHLQEGTIAETREALSDLDARVFSREAALESGLFGDRESSEIFERRCGDLILTHRRQGTWYGDEEPDELAYIGMHGGLNPAEMLVPFAAVRADRLA